MNSARRWIAATGTLVLVAALAAAPARAGGRGRVNKKATSNMKLAERLYQGGRLPEALKAVEKALEEAPKYTQARLLRGMVLYSMGVMEDALKEFDRVLKADRAYTDARIYRGSALANLKRYDEAMGEYERALEDLTYPWPERIHCNIGMLHRETGNPEAAVESLLRAIQINPSYARGHYELGVTYEQMGKDPDALRAYQDALVGMDESAELHLRLGLALRKAGDTHAARQHFEKVTRLAPHGPEAARAREQIEQIEKVQPPS